VRLNDDTPCNLMNKVMHSNQLALPQLHVSLWVASATQDSHAGKAPPAHLRKVCKSPGVEIWLDYPG
jgi:hypothetical protein